MLSLRAGESVTGNETCRDYLFTNITRIADGH